MAATIGISKADLLRIHGIEEDFMQPEKDWRSQLQTSEKGKIFSNAFNTLLILRNDEQLEGKFAFNLLTGKPELVGEAPWSRLDATNAITDHDDSCLRNYLSMHYGNKSKDTIYDALNQIVSEKQYQPVREYLKSVRDKWDRKPRLDSLLIDYMGADDTELNRRQTRIAFVGAVKRAFEPGCKFDYVLTLKGDQGVGKSSFIQTLAVNSEWFSDSLDDMRGKDAKEQLQGIWICELGEMAAVSKGDQKRTKQFITSTHDQYRPAYGRRTVNQPRQFIFIATTNDEEPLKDDTGGRRWWIVEVKDKWFEKGPLEVDQIWPEAVNVYYEMIAKGEPLKLPDYLENEARKIQTENTDRGLYAEEIVYVLQRGYIEVNNFQGKTKLPINETCAIHVWESVLGRHRNDLKPVTAREINSTLKNIEGWERIGRKIFHPYGKQTVYRRMDI